MSKILHSDTTTIGKWGNSLGVRLKQFYAELSGMDNKDTEIKQAVIQGQHGIFIGLWLQGEQPQLEDIPEQKLQELLENKEVE